MYGRKLKIHLLIPEKFHQTLDKPWTWTGLSKRHLDVEVTPGPVGCFAIVDKVFTE